MKIKVRCTGRAENTDKDGSGTWTYAFVVVADPRDSKGIAIQFSLHSKEKLHYKREDVFDLNLSTHSGIHVVGPSSLTQ